MIPNLLFSSDCYLWALQHMCQLQRVSFTPDLVLQQIPPPYGLPAFQQAAQSLGLRCLTREARLSELPELPLPCLAVLKSVVAPEGNAAPHGKRGNARQEHHTLAILLRCDADRVLYVEVGSHSPVASTPTEFGSRYAGSVVLLGQEKWLRVDDEQGAGNSSSFGFNWFVPELLKHKAIWREVLLASLTIQLLALAIPILTQIVIDKVIVHHTMNTLVVIGLAFLAAVLFTAGMNWIRQYLTQ